MPREDVVRLGLWMFLATVTMLFAAFSSAYLVRRGGGDWLALPLPSRLGANTIVLVASSLALELAWRAGRGRHLRSANVAVGLAVALGLGFVAGQWSAWQDWQRAGLFLPTNPSTAFFYMMTAAHGLHVVAALIVLAWGAALTWRGDPVRHPREWAAAFGHCRTFWHFLLAVWIYVYAFMSLV
jgi:cytochrome c oxidase subunit 3